MHAALEAFAGIARRPVAELAKAALLVREHLNKRLPMALLLECLEHLLLVLRHRTTDAMARAAELAHIDAGRRRFVLFSHLSLISG